VDEESEEERPSSKRKDSHTVSDESELEKRVKTLEHELENLRTKSSDYDKAQFINNLFTAAGKGDWEEVKVLMFNDFFDPRMTDRLLVWPPMVFVYIDYIYIYIYVLKHNVYLNK